jgi:hypothetical protein
MITINEKDYQLDWVYVHSSNNIDFFHIINSGTNYTEINALIEELSSIEILNILTDKQDEFYNHFSPSDITINTYYGV